MRCIAALILLFAAATNALAPVASIMGKSKKVAKKQSNKKSKTPPKLESARPIKKPERLADLVELDAATLERIEALVEDATSINRKKAPLTKFPPVRDFKEGQEFVIFKNVVDEDTGMTTCDVCVYRKSYAGMNELEKRHARLDAFEQSKSRAETLFDEVAIVNLRRSKRFDKLLDHHNYAKAWLERLVNKEIELKDWEWHDKNIAASQNAATALSEEEMETKLAKALQRRAMGVITGIDTPDDCARVAHVLIHPAEDGEPLFVGNDKLKPFVDEARGRVFSLRVVVPMA